MLEKAAGAIALMPLVRVRAKALSVPSVDGEGEMSLRASCTAAKHLYQRPMAQLQRATY